MSFSRAFYFVVFLYSFAALTIWAQSNGVRAHSGYKRTIEKPIHPKKEHLHTARLLRHTPLSTESNEASQLVSGITKIQQHHASVPHHRLLKSPKHHASTAVTAGHVDTVSPDHNKHLHYLKHTHVAPKRQQRHSQHHHSHQDTELPSAQRIEAVTVSPSKETVTATPAVHDGRRRLDDETKRRSFHYALPQRRQRRRYLLGNSEHGGLLGSLGLFPERDGAPLLPLIPRVLDNHQDQGLLAGPSNSPLLPVGKAGEGLFDTVADTLHELPALFGQNRPLLGNNILGNTLAAARETVSTLPILGGVSSELGGGETLGANLGMDSKAENLIRDSVATAKGAVKEVAENFVSSARTVASSATKATKAGETLLKSTAQRVLHLPAAAREMIRDGN